MECVFRLLWKPQIIDKWNTPIQALVHNEIMDPFLFDAATMDCHCMVNRILVGQMTQLALHVEFIDKQTREPVEIVGWNIESLGSMNTIPTIVFDIIQNDVIVKIPWTLQIVQRAFNVTPTKWQQWKLFLEDKPHMIVNNDSSTTCEIQLPLTSYQCGGLGCMCRDGLRGPVELTGSECVQYFGTKKSVLIQLYCNEVSTHRGSNPDNVRPASKSGGILSSKNPFCSLFWFQTTFGNVKNWDESGPFITLEKYGDRYKSALLAQNSAFLVGRRPKPADLPIMEAFGLFKSSLVKSKNEPKAIPKKISDVNEVTIPAVENNVVAVVADETVLVNEQNDQEKTVEHMELPQSETVPIQNEINENNVNNVKTQKPNSKLVGGIFVEPSLVMYNDETLKWETQVENNVDTITILPDHLTKKNYALDFHFGKRVVRNTAFALFNNVSMVERVVVNNWGSQISFCKGIPIVIESVSTLPQNPQNTNNDNVFFLKVSFSKDQEPINEKSNHWSRHAFVKGSLVEPNVIRVPLTWDLIHAHCSTDVQNEKVFQVKMEMTFTDEQGTFVFNKSLAYNLQWTCTNSSKYMIPTKVNIKSNQESGQKRKLLTVNENNNNGHENDLWKKIVDAIEVDRNVTNKNENIDHLLAQRDILLRVAQQYRTMLSSQSKSLS